MMTRFFIILMSAVLALTVIIGAASATSAEKLTSGITTTVVPSVELINSRISEVASGSLPDNEKDKLADLYSKAISSLGLTVSQRKKASDYNAIIENGPDEVARLKVQLNKKLDQSALALPAVIDMPLPEIEQELQKLKADLALAETAFNEYKNQLASEKERPVKIRERLLEVKRLLAELSSLLDQSKSEEETTELKEAKSWVNITLQEQLRTEGLMLEQELSSHPTRLELLTAKLDIADIDLQNLKNSVVQLEEAANDIRQDEAEKAKAEAIAAEREAASKHPVVAQLATRNTDLSEQIDRLANEIEDINKSEDEAAKSANRFEEAFNTTRQKLDIAGLSQVLGQVLQQERRALPDVRHFQKLTNIREKKIADTSLSQIQLEQERRRLRDISSYISDLTAELPIKQQIELVPEISVLVNSRKTLIDNALNVQRVYLQALGELDISQRRQQQAVERYADFLGKRLLWIRSTEQVSLATVQSIPGQVTQLFAANRWSNVLHTLFKDVLLVPLTGLALVFVLAVLALRHKIWQQLIDTGANVGNLRLDRLNQTLKAIFLVVLLALPGPVLLMVIGSEMTASIEADNFSKLVGNSLTIMAPLLFHLMAFRLFLAPGSVATVHFGWEKVGVARLYGDLGWFTLLVVSLTFFAALAFQDASLGSGSGLSRSMFIVLMTAFAVFFYRLTKPTGGVLSSLAGGKSDSILIRFRFFWFMLFVLPPVASIFVSLAGYMFTAGTLIERILQSTWFALLVIVIHQFILRWLTLNQRRLRLDVLRARRRAEQEARETRDKEDDIEGLNFREIEEPEVDLGALSYTSRKLLDNALIFVGLLGVWAIWRDVLPALQILSDINLWSYTRSGDNEIVPITLSSLILALLVIIVTVIATRQLPAFLEIILLQRLNMSQGSRYTVTTLTRYTIIAVGIAWIFGFLGGSWSEIQWIFAALGVGIGFGLQEIVANFISGLIILFERPIRVGDVVTVGNTDGVVTRIQIRATTIRNFDRKELLVPNKNFITQELLNWSLSDQTTRIMIQVGVAYGSDAGKALRIMEEVAHEHHRVLQDPAPFTVFESFGDNALLLSLRCYIDDIDYRLRTMTEINLAINERMNEAGITIAFPQRDIHLDTLKPLDIRIHRTSDQP